MTVNEAKSIVLAKRPNAWMVGMWIRSLPRRRVLYEIWTTCLTNGGDCQEISLVKEPQSCWRGSTQQRVFSRSMRKYNAAVLAGWRVLRYSPSAVAAGMAIDEVREILTREA